ncbi:hypothetical protein M9Y10_041116 [Tritrichomonas musculus]|uniref:DOMON domain-containing protein n=1 Tax=Tritrichomonas musculus TaxID=1915356 RepID=A0ABR2K3J8_9EUKA
MLWLAFILGIRQNCNARQFDIHGEVSVLQTNDKGWAYAGVGFGDFGHNIRVRAWEVDDELTIYMEYGHKCPTNESKIVEGAKIFLESSSQYAIFGFKSRNARVGNVTVSIASTVRPIHPNSPQTAICSLFVFFTVNFVLAGFLQLYYFRGAMDPNEYRVAE